ncbi:geranylgeranyl reductase family protein [Micromonospora sp. NPDC050397]|uniref:geranylgeranyl reductase family protein n=1 Tax=Micromonospora sp. NPDC050397 TaxID=3364279 RepID=UPI00384AECEC
MAGAAGADRLDAVVVGAGPAGSATAYHLARRGRRVLLVDRRDFPRDKSCGDALTRTAVRLLGEIGVLDELTGAARVGGVRVRMRGRGSRDLWYDGDGPVAYGMVVPRLELDAKLCHRAVRAGATLWSDARATYLLGEPGAVRGVEIERDGRRMAVRAPVVVAADGAGSGLGRQAGLRSAERDRTGFAARGYFADVTGLDPLLEIHLPLFDVTERFLLPSYGWVFPVGGGVVNVGVGLFDPAHRDSVRGLYERFVTELTSSDPRFRRARPVGRMSGAPLRLDFDPARCGVPGLLLVGDAAGLASPFTGEGISLALESGALAATRIDEALRESADDPVDPAPYARALASRHAGYFEAGRQTARRYLLGWRVLESTFDDDRPIFELCRRLAFLPDGARADRLLSPLPAMDPVLGRALRRDLLAVAELLTGCVRDDWPMFVRLVAPDEELAAVGLRPAVLLLLAGYVGGRRDPVAHALAAAVDLGLLAGLALDGAGPPPPGTATGGPPVPNPPGAGYAVLRVPGWPPGPATAPNDRATAPPDGRMTAPPGDRVTAPPGGRVTAPPAGRATAPQGGRVTTGRPGTGDGPSVGRLPSPRGAPPPAGSGLRQSAGPGPTPWGSRFAVLAADYLLARAYELAARGGAAVVAEFAEALTVSCEARAVELGEQRRQGTAGPSTPPWAAATRPGDAGRLGDSRDGDLSARVELLAGRMATIFELPCRLGARLGGASASVVEALAGYGRHLGVSHALTEELRARGGAGPDRVVPTPRVGGAGPGRRPDDQGSGRRPDDQGAGQRAEIARLAEEHGRRAREALARVPDGPARDLLRLIGERSWAGSVEPPARPGMRHDGKRPERGH